MRWCRADLVTKAGIYSTTARCWRRASLRPSARMPTSAASTSGTDVGDLRRSGFPAWGVELEQLSALVPGQREQASLVRAKQVGPAWRWTAAHEHRGIAVVPQADGMAQLVGDHVTRDVGQVHRGILDSADPDDALRIGVERTGERDDLRIGEQNPQIAGEVAEDLGDGHRPARTADHGEAQRVQRLLRHWLHDARDGSESEACPDLLQGLVPEGDGLVDDLTARIGLGADDGDGRRPRPRHADPGVLELEDPGAGKERDEDDEATDQRLHSAHLPGGSVRDIKSDVQISEMMIPV